MGHRVEICEKCGKVIEKNEPQASVTVYPKDVEGLGGGTSYLHSEICGECAVEMPGLRDVFNALVEIEGSPVEYVAPKGFVVAKAEYTKHGPCYFHACGVCTCGLLMVLKSFPYRNEWYPDFEKEWKSHSEKIERIMKNKNPLDTKNAMSWPEDPK